jgi:hypothetical protein
LYPQESFRTSGPLGSVRIGRLSGLELFMQMKFSRCNFEMPGSNSDLRGGSESSIAQRQRAGISNSAFSRANLITQHYYGHPGAECRFAATPTRLYIVTLVNGSPRIPSWIARDRKRMLSAAARVRNGFESSSCCRNGHPIKKKVGSNH